MKKYWSLSGIFSSFDFRKCNNIWWWDKIKDKWQPNDLRWTKLNSQQSTESVEKLIFQRIISAAALSILSLVYKLLISAVLFELSNQPALAAGSRQPASKQCFYYFSILLSNWKESYLFLVFDLLTQTNKTLLCCATTKSSVHFQPPNKWLAWFIWVISAMWRSSTTSLRRMELPFTTTGQTR